MPKIVFSFLLLFLVQLLSYGQDGEVLIGSNFFNADTAKQLILINKDLAQVNLSTPEIKKNISAGGQSYSFDPPIEEFELGISYQVNDISGKIYELFLTQLPIININPSDSIVDEPRIHASFEMMESDGNHTEQNIGIEIRGGVSQFFPKRSFRIEFWEDQMGEDKKNVRLLGMRNDDDWNLQGMYNEPLMIRSKLNYELWTTFGKVYYADQEPEATHGIQQEYVEFFMDGIYQGLYALSERIDRKQLQLKSYEEEEEEIHGELYKAIRWAGATTYDSIQAYQNDTTGWAGFKYTYPNDIVDWSNLYDLVDFIVNEDSLVFYDTYQEKIDLDNAVDYFIFLNLLKAQDNTGKNIYVARYDKEEPYFFIPWDLDGTYGVLWNGSTTPNTERILSNGLYDKLFCDTRANGFLERLKERWMILRQDIITVENIFSKFESQFQFLQSNGVYDRERIAWPTTEFLNLSNINFTEDWLINRIAYLDQMFSNPELLGAELIDKFTQEEEEEMLLKIFPNPAKDLLYIFSSSTELSNIEVTVYNAIGQFMKSYFVSERIQTIDIAELSSGIYFLEVNDGNSRKAVKISVQN